MSKILIRAIHLTNSVNPHKLILIYLEHKNKVAMALAERIRRELRQAHLNALQTDQIVYSPQVPYTVVITGRTMTDGVLQLQHFKPKIKEEVHVSNLTERLTLQMRGTVQ